MANIADTLLERGRAYNDYVDQSVAELESIDLDKVDQLTADNAQYIQLNWHRTQRIHKTYEVDHSLKNIIAEISEPQTWVVLTEFWCGDSAQNLPYIVKMAKLNPMISLVILNRDQNPELMDQYLTNGGRAVPKLIAFDQNFEEIFQWGPRPMEAAELFKDLKRKGWEKPEINQKLHLWYGRNRGKALEQEFSGILSEVVQFAYSG